MIKDQNIKTLLDKICSDKGSRPCFFNENSILSFSNLRDLSYRLATYISNLSDINTCPTIVCCLPLSFQSVITFYASQILNANIWFINNEHLNSDLELLLTEHQIDLVIFDENVYKNVVHLKEKGLIKHCIITSLYEHFSLLDQIMNFFPSKNSLVFSLRFPHFTECLKTRNTNLQQVNTNQNSTFFMIDSQKISIHQAKQVCYEQMMQIFFENHHGSHKALIESNHWTIQNSIFCLITLPLMGFETRLLLNQDKKKIKTLLANWDYNILMASEFFYNKASKITQKNIAKTKALQLSLLSHGNIDHNISNVWSTITGNEIDVASLSKNLPQSKLIC